jgi:hypothetical protein
MPDLDRDTARALAEAGYMPLSEYIRMFGDELAASKTLLQAAVPIGDHRSRPWTLPPHLASPAQRYRPGSRKRRSAA